MGSLVSWSVACEVWCGELKLASYIAAAQGRPWTSLEGGREEGNLCVRSQ